MRGPEKHLLVGSCSPEAVASEGGGAWGWHGDTTCGQCAGQAVKGGREDGGPGDAGEQRAKGMEAAARPRCRPGLTQELDLRSQRTQRPNFSKLSLRRPLAHSQASPRARAAATAKTTLLQSPAGGSGHPLHLRTHTQPQPPQSQTPANCRL